MTEYILIYYDNDQNEKCKRFLTKSKMESFIKSKNDNIFYYISYKGININSHLNLS